MAKFFITNIKTVSDNLQKIYTTAGFQNFEIKNIKNLYIYSSKKKRKPIDNFWCDGSGDLIIVVGTLTYKGSNKGEILTQLFDDIKTDNISDIRKKIIGNYIIAIRKHNIMTVFSDRYNIIPAYYWQDGEKFAITNSCWHLASATNSHEIDRATLIQETFLVAPVGRKTVFKKIKKLFGDSYIQITNDNFRIAQLKISDEYLYVNELSFERIIEEYSNLVKSEFSNVIYSFKDGEFGLHQTGGLDNRTIFAAFMNHGVKPVTYYGVGNTTLTNTNVEDFKIVQDYRDRFQLNLKILDWSNHLENDILMWENQIYRYGFLQSIYGGSENFFAAYESNINDIPDFIEFGYYGEVLRQREWAYQRENSKEYYTLDEFLDGYLFDVGYGGLFRDKFCSLFKKAREEIKNEYINELNEQGLLFEDVFHIDDWNKIEWTHMRNNNSISCQLMNDFTSSIALFSTEKLHNYALNIPSRYLHNAKFQLALIETLNREVLEIPILSHGERYQYCEKTKELKPINRKNANTVDNIKKYINKIPILNKYLKHFYRRFLKRDKSYIKIKYEIDKILNDNKDILNVQTVRYNDNLVYYAILGMYVYAISLIRKNVSLNKHYK